LRWVRAARTSSLLDARSNVVLPATLDDQAAPPWLLALSAADIGQAAYERRTGRCGPFLRLARQADGQPRKLASTLGL